MIVKRRATHPHRILFPDLSFPNHSAFAVATAAHSRLPETRAMLGEYIDVMMPETMPIDAMVGSDLTPNDDPHQRKHARLRVNAALTLRPGNASDRQLRTTTGICRDISATGFAAVLETPPHVGDIYWAEFDQHQIQFDALFVRCMRCRFLNENSYEAAFAFFTEQAVPQLTAASAHVDDDLL